MFGPHPRDYSQSIPKKMNRGAIRCLLSQKAREEKLMVLDEFQLKTAKTREMAGVLSALGVSTPALLVTDRPQMDLILSARNLQRIMTLPASQLNPLDLLNHDRVIITVDAVRRAEELWATGETRVEADAPGESES